MPDAKGMYIDPEQARAYVEANYQGDPLLRHLYGKLLENLPKVEAPRWIPVTEGLPATVPCGAGTAYSEAVNVLTSGRKVLTAIFDGADFITDAEFWEAGGEEITHWAPVPMPLPLRIIQQKDGRKNGQSET